MTGPAVRGAQFFLAGKGSVPAATPLGHGGRDFKPFASASACHADSSECLCIRSRVGLADRFKSAAQAALL